MATTFADDDFQDGLTVAQAATLSRRVRPVSESSSFLPPAQNPGFFRNLSSMASTPPIQQQQQPQGDRVSIVLAHVGPDDTAAQQNEDQGGGDVAQRALPNPFPMAVDNPEELRAIKRKLYVAASDDAAEVWGQSTDAKVRQIWNLLRTHDDAASLLAHLPVDCIPVLRTMALTIQLLSGDAHLMTHRNEARENSKRRKLAEFQAMTAAVTRAVAQNPNLNFEL